jgi:hypothetical protein
MGDMIDITGGVASERTYRFDTEHGTLFIAKSALEALAESDKARYYNLIHEDEELWEAEWCCRPVEARTRH